MHTCPEAQQAGREQTDNCAGAVEPGRVKVLTGPEEVCVSPEPPAGAAAAQLPRPEATAGSPEERETRPELVYRRPEPHAKRPALLLSREVVSINYSLLTTDPESSLT